jgi:hypothetical protein
MLISSIVLFALAALVGITIFTYILKAKETPKLVVYLHGLVAAIALVLLLIYAIQNPEHRPLTSLILFVIGALFGFTVFARDLMKKSLPIFLVVVHALIGVAAFILLLMFYLE